MKRQLAQPEVHQLTRGPIPLYYQIANLVRSAILSGDWSPGQRLPSEDALCREYAVSRSTIRKAKRILIEDGLIRDIRGSGSYITDQGSWEPNLPTVDNLNEIFHIGSRMSFRIHEIGMVPNTGEVKRRLKNPEDRFVFRIRGARFHQGRAISCAMYYLPFRFGSRIPLQSLDENPFIPQIERLAGIRVLEGVQTISLGRADEHAARHLGVRKGGPVLLVRTVYFDEQGQPVEYVLTQYREALPYSVRVRRQ